MTFVSQTNINNDTLVEFNKVRFLSKETFERENQRTDVAIGDIFFTSVGSLGRSCVYTGGYNICFQRSVSVILRRARQGDRCNVRMPRLDPAPQHRYLAFHRSG